MPARRVAAPPKIAFSFFLFAAIERFALLFDDASAAPQVVYGYADAQVPQQRIADVRKECAMPAARSGGTASIHGERRQLPCAHRRHMPCGEAAQAASAPCAASLFIRCHALIYTIIICSPSCPTAAAR